ncbi:hypothetical protein BDV12DRAFT_205553 [Aspergillus spectabilis]
MSTIFTRRSDALDVLFDAARQPSEEVLDLWDKCRFVRQGWFTAQEAVTYLDLFYRYLAPLSPVLTDSYRDHSNHVRLIGEEPMLCCTLLMISSRHFILPGAGGVSRSHFIHQRLWQYCELLIRRLMFGQEKHSTAKTRIVGSIESLILISDWHPRSVHFPPDTEGWDGELISPAYDRRNRLHTNGDVPLIRWREDVFEPARRSERMSWMLLGAATSLAYELGIFDGATASDPQLNARYNRAARLLYVYTTQMAVKMGCLPLLPDNMPVAAAAQPTAEAAIDPQWSTSSLTLVEYHYLKSCTSALSIQAVVERAVARSTTQLTEGVESCILPQDHTFIRDVVSGSRSVLEIASTMASEGQLRYAPLRTLICITSSSILLLKAISLGARYADLQTSLDTLDKCIIALRSSGTDDMDFTLHSLRNIQGPLATSTGANIGTGSFGSYTSPLAQRQHHDDTLGLSGTTPYNTANSINWTQQPYAGLDQMSAGEDWWARPFDPNIAPFSTGGAHGEGVSLGLGLDSLDFLWNLPIIGDVNLPP